MLAIEVDSSSKLDYKLDNPELSSTSCTAQPAQIPPGGTMETALAIQTLIILLLFAKFVI
jgi:hypothetical protein